MLHYVNKKLKKIYATRHGGAWGERRHSSYSFLVSALEGSEWSASRPGRTSPAGNVSLVPTVQEAGWAGLDAQVRGKILCLWQRSNTSRPVRRQTLYWATRQTLRQQKQMKCIWNNCYLFCVTEYQRL
jgi:hypothetical protein